MDDREEKEWKNLKENVYGIDGNGNVLSAMQYGWIIRLL